LKTCEITFNKEKNEVLCTLWIHEEDQVELAEKYLLEFNVNPLDSKYSGSLAQNLKEEQGISAIESPAYMRRTVSEKTPSFFLTYFFLAFCVFVFFLNSIQEMGQVKKNPISAAFFITPIESAFLFDAPVSLLEMNKIVESYTADPNANPQEIAAKMSAEVQKFSRLPYFRGFYSWLVNKSGKEMAERVSGPMFVKIKEGQIWRFFTPCVLHKDLLHILFNMLWLWVLGKQIELRVPRFRILLMIVITAIVSNTAQYLMSGPYFLGFSGVIMGMAGFIWMRQRVAPWEGYPLHPTTILFLGIFVGGMFALQFASFLIQIFGWGSFAPNIANTAHIAGALIGALLGRMPFFSWRALER
jgi:GlpG protein